MKRHILFILTLMVVTATAWYKILFQMFLGEGYYYFGRSFFRDLSLADKIVRYDKGTFLLFEILSSLFRDNIFWYQLFALITLLALGVFLYFLVYEISGKKLIAFIAALLFGVSYNGNFQMFAIGNYQFFVQRVVFFLLLIPSAIFLIRFLRSKKEKHFFMSVFFYSVSLYLSKFSIFFLPFIINYLLLFMLLSVRTAREKFNLVIRTFYYLIPTIVFLRLEAKWGSSFLLQDKSFFTFLNTERNIIVEELQRQLTSLLIPPQVINFLLDFLQSQSLKNTIESLYIPTLIILIGVIVYSLKKNTIGRVAIISAALFIPMVFILNIFTRGNDYIGRMVPGNRYLFVPLIGASLIFSFFFHSLLSYRSIILKSVAIFTIIFLVYLNILATWKQIDSAFYDHLAAKKSIEFVKQLSPKFASDSFIIVPSIMGRFGVNFLQIYFGKENTMFTPFFAGWDQDMKRPFDPKKDYILKYDYKKREAINITSNYEEIFKQRLKKRINKETNFYDDMQP